MTNAAGTSHTFFTRSISKFPVNFSSSNDYTINSILADIPLFCVGLLAFAMFTFFLIMKRVNLLGIYLYSSSLLAFAAAILDLSEILAQSRPIPDRLSTLGSGSGFAVAREVGLALSVGFRYVFFWAYVAQSLRSGFHLIISDDDRLDSDTVKHSHTVSWTRWGYLGLGFKWASLMLSLSIPILQIVWRNVPAQNQFGGVYITESAIEIAVSALFILKLLLNLSLAPPTLQRSSLRSYVTPVLALLLSAGLGAGNLVSFAFSETTLGRFLQAVELYILILFLLVVAFYNVPIPAMSLPRTTTVSSITGLPKKDQESNFRMSLPTVNAPEEMIRGRSTPPQTRTDRTSAISRFSVWIKARRNSKRQLWNEEGADRGIPPATQETFTGVSATQNSTVAELKDSRAYPVTALNAKSEIRRIFDRGSIAAPPTTKTSFGTAVAPRMRPPNLPFLDMSVAPSYGVQNSSRSSSPAPMSIMPRQLESPVYGLNGIIVQHQIRDSLQDAARPTSNAGSFDELLRQQTELDRSIAALRLFSPPAINSSPEPSVLKRANSVDTSAKGDRSSVRSEFSLSVFPDPPAAASDKLEFLRVQPRIKQTGTTANVIDLVGSQYDVPSFIGGSTDSDDALAEVSGTLDSSDIEPGKNTPTIFTATAGLTTTRQAILQGTAPHGSTRASSGILTSPVNLETYPVKPFTQAAASTPMMPSSSSAVPSRSETKAPFGLPRGISGGRKGARLRSRPKISGPRPPPLDGRGDQAPEAFERPRPPPLR